ncbi:DUF6282 family protein [Pseudonocardia sp. NPDC049635]|uniref:DUF6282 family protein n=1 Tax=Pseudonocardia sp. NPDC049635 TaxID=3155506 RepID=UPI0033EA7102
MSNEGKLMEQRSSAPAEVDGILHGAVDLHVHPAPSPFPRRLTLRDAAVQAAEAGFLAIVVKSHHHSMVTDVIAVDQAVGGLPLPVYSGIPLNSTVGGLNVHAVEMTLALGGKAVWFPTISATKHMCLHEELNFPDPAITMRDPEAVPVLDEDGKLLPAAREIIDLIRAHDAILMAGHSDASTVDALIDGALAAGVERIVVNHPNFVVGADLEICRSWARRGVTLEHSLCMYDERSHLSQASLDELLAYIDIAGPEHTIFGSDLGQAGNPFPVESYRLILGLLLERGIAADDLHTMCAVNGARLLGA